MVDPTSISNTPEVLQYGVAAVCGFVGGVAFLEQAKTSSRAKRVLGLFICTFMGVLLGENGGRLLSWLLPKVFYPDDPLLIGAGAFGVGAIMPWFYNVLAAIANSIRENPKSFIEIIVNAWLRVRGRIPLERRDPYAYDDDYEVEESRPDDWPHR